MKPINENERFASHTGVGVPSEKAPCVNAPCETDPIATVPQATVSCVTAPRVTVPRVTVPRLSLPSWAISEAEVTPEAVFKERRVILKALGLGVLGSSLPVTAQAGLFDAFGDKTPTFVPTPLQYTSPERFQDLSEPLTGEVKITTHNNFYEFGTDKADPAQYAQGLITNPWQLRVDGLVDKPLELDHDDLLKLFPLEERIYRLRCVEAWSMVIPWLGFPLAALLNKAGVNSSATHVAFETLYDPSQMPGQRNRMVGGGVNYPYVEGLTVAEAMNELSLLSVGLYGKTLPPQNGAPIRLVVPWKYGFKSIKSVVRITLMDKQPPTSWNLLAPEEYGFYANVNPAVDHPRWSQASERRIGPEGLFSASRIPTRPFNGYQAEVGHLYSAMDLTRFY